MKYVVLAGALVGLACIVASTPADARRACPRGGFCSPGTCAQ